MLPCLPARSPTWQVAGIVALQGGFSPRLYGSWWARVAVQLPSAGTGWSWMWYTARHVLAYHFFTRQPILQTQEECLQKGPNEASGKPLKLTWKVVPTPPGPVVPMMEPRMLVVLLSGRVAV